MSDKDQFSSNAQGSVEEDVDQLKRVMTGITIVLLIGVVGILVTLGAFINDSLAEKKAISQDMRDQMFQQNLKLDALAEEIQKLKK